MRERSRVLGVMLAMVGMICFLAVPCFGQDHATKDECVAKVREAVKLIKDVGLDEACKKIMDKAGPYQWKDSYVFCTDDKDAKILAHPATRFVGFPLKNYKDADGKTPFVEVLEVAGAKGEGWKSYMFLKPGADKPLLKTIYFIREPGSKTIVSAGFYKYE